MSHDDHAHCHCVAEHRPPYLELERHHLWPLYLGGPDIPENMVWICATTHGSVHELIRLMGKAGRVLTYAEVDEREDRTVSRYAYQLAVAGFSRHIMNLEEVKDDAA